MRPRARDLAPWSTQRVKMCTVATDGRVIRKGPAVDQSTSEIMCGFTDRFVQLRKFRLRFVAPIGWTNPKTGWRRLVFLGGRECNFEKSGDLGCDMGNLGSEKVGTQRDENVSRSGRIQKSGERRCFAFGERGSHFVRAFGPEAAAKGVPIEPPQRRGAANPDCSDLYLVIPIAKVLVESVSKCTDRV